MLPPVRTTSGGPPGLRRNTHSTTARGTECYLMLWLRLWGALGTPDFNVHIVKNGQALPGHCVALPGAVSRDARC